jgi:hypothetical protein
LVHERQPEKLTAPTDPEGAQDAAASAAVVAL